MGTSQASPGSPSGVPMLPPWTPDPDAPDAPPTDADDLPVPLAPRARFYGARRSLGDFVREGNAESLRRGVGHYVRQGLGGGATAVRRFGGTISAASRLNNALFALSRGTPVEGPGGRLDPLLLSGRSAREIIDALIEVVVPTDGTLDGEARREAMNDALSEVLETYPEADLLNLGENERELVIEVFVAEEVYRRFDLDVGESIRSNAHDLNTGLHRLQQAWEYIRTAVASAFRSLREDGRVVSGDISQVVRDALRKAVDVFEEWIG